VAVADRSFPLRPEEGVEESQGLKHEDELSLLRHLYALQRRQLSEGALSRALSLVVVPGLLEFFEL
jgi:hypothetical protein